MTPNQDQGSTEPIRILHVDDEQNTLLIAARMMMSFDPNLQVESTTSPSEALEMIKNNEYDCIVSDYRMPAIDGIQLAERIREESNIPIILYTGQGSEEVAERAFGAGVDDYLRKEMEPAHYQVLAKRIRAAVESYRAETRLHGREQELSSLIENSMDGIFRVEMSRGVTRCNPAFLGFFGYSLGELQSMGMGMLELIHEEDMAQFKSELDDLSSRRLEKYSSLNRWRTKGGGVIWLDSSVSALVEDEKFIGVEIIARDVTEQRRAEVARAHYVNRLESIHKHASSLSQSQTIKEVVKATLDGVEEIFGFEQMSFTEVQGDVIKAVEIRSDSPPVRTEFPLDGEGIIPMVARTGVTANIPDVRKHTDYFAANSSTLSELTVPIKVEDDVCAIINIESNQLANFSSDDQKLIETFSMHIASAMTTIGSNRERKQMEEELRRFEERYRMFLESSRDAIFVITDGKYTYVNNRLVDLLGYESKQELMALSPHENIAQEDRARANAMIKGRPRGEEHPSRYTIKAICKDGSTIHLENHVSLIDFEDQQSTLVFARDITDRKEIEAKLLERDAEKQAILDTLTDFTSLKDKEFRFIWVNRALAESIGRTPDELIGKICYEAYFERRDPCVGCSMDKVFETGKSSHDTVIGDDGRIFDSHLEPVMDESGKTQYVLQTSRDITEHRKMEEELKNSEERLELIVEYAPDAIYLNDLKGTFIDGNRAAEKLTGYTRDELIGKNFMKLNLLSRRQLPKAAKLLAQNIMGQPTGPDDFTMTRKNGEQISVEISTYPVKLKDGPVVMGIARDISSRKAYERKLEALLLHASQLASAQTVEEVSTISLDTMNDALEYDLHSFQTVENDTLIIRGIRGAPSWNVPLPMDGKGITAKAAREARSILLNDVRKDPDFIKGSTESLSELAVPVISKGRVVAVLNVESERLDAFTLRDQQLLELLANHIASALQRIWSQIELMEMRERHSVELVRGVQRVSSMVRHDLRGPLQTIMNANYLMEKDPDSFDEMRTLIKSSIKHANEIMEDWKNQGIDEQLTRSDTDIRELIEEALKISLIPSEVKVSNIVEPMVLHLDRIKTRRVLDNLIRNAVEAMPEGGALSIEGRVDGDVYLLEVKDTGIGISEDGLSNLFTPFYTTKPNGMGIGLTFCKRTLEAHGGTIEVNTIEGKGTTFTLNIPTGLSLTHSHTEQLDEITVDKQA